MNDPEDNGGSRLLASSTNENSRQKFNFKNYLADLKNKYSPKKPREEDKKDHAPKNEILESDIPITPVENLQPAQRLFFHTAPAHILGSIEQQGVFALKSNPNMGSRLGYSLFFAYEREYGRHEARTGQKADKLRILEDTPDDYYLTIWRPHSQLRKASSYKNSGLGAMVYTGLPQAEVPETFYQSSTESEFLVRSIPQEIRNLPADALLAAVPLDKEIREELLKGMVLAAAGKITGNEIEESLSQKLANKDVKSYQGLSIKELSHELAATIQKELIRAVMPYFMDRSKNSSPINYSEFSNRFMGILVETLTYAYIFRCNVNDKVSARYLDSCIRSLEKRIKEQQVDLNGIHRQIGLLKSSLSAGQTKLGTDSSYYSQQLQEYYGGGNSSIAAYLMEKQLGLTS